VKIVFWGTPEFAVPSLRALVGEGYEVVAVVTRPDRPAGRGRLLTPSAVKRAALEEGLTVLTPDRPRGDEFLELIADLAPDLSVVVAYGHILTRTVLDIPRLGSINVHASLLPELRGAAPVHWAIARGYQETGVTVMRMVEAMDAGPILYRVSEPIYEDESASELAVRLAEVGASALLEALALLSVGEAEEVEQDADAVTFAPKVDRETARIDWTRSAREVSCHVRAMDETPGAWTTLDGVALKLFRPVVRPAAASAAATGGNTSSPSSSGADGPARPGAVLRADPDDGLLVAAGEGSVLFGEVQPPGSRRMAVADWIHGRGIRVGQRFV